MKVRYRNQSFMRMLLPSVSLHSNKVWWFSMWQKPAEAGSLRYLAFLI